MEKMDSDVDGRSAFEMLLNRLIEETREAHMTRERLGDTTGDLRIAEKQFHEAVTEMQRLRAQLEKAGTGEPKITELWNAAQSAHDFLRDLIAAAEPNERASATRERLQKALDGSEDYVDLIPF